MSTHQAPGSPNADLRTVLGDELRSVVDETPAPVPTRLLRGAVTRGRTIRARRRTAVAGGLVAAAAVAVAVVPGLVDGSQDPAGVPTAGAPAPQPGPRFDASVPCAGSRLECRVPHGLVVDDTRLQVSSLGSSTAVPGATVRMQVATGSRRDAVAVGNVALAGVRPSGIVVRVDGRRVGAFSGGAMHVIPVPRGKHWVRVDLDGPPTPRSALTVAHYEPPMTFGGD